jgi:hypothetical protein
MFLLDLVVRLLRKAVRWSRILFAGKGGSTLCPVCQGAGTLVITNPETCLPSRALFCAPCVGIGLVLCNKRPSPEDLDAMAAMLSLQHGRGHAAGQRPDLCPRCVVGRWVDGVVAPCVLLGGTIPLRVLTLSGAVEAYERSKALGKGFAPDGENDSVLAAVAHYVLLGGECVLEQPTIPLRFAVVRFGPHLTAIAGDERGRHAWAVPIEIASPKPKEPPPS